MNQDYRLDRDFEIIGIWILPGEKFSNGTTGKLSFIDGRFKLEVYGELKQNEGDVGLHLFGDDQSYEEYILGFSQEGYSIVLNRNHQTKHKQSFPGTAYSVYHVEKSLFMKVNYAHYDYTPESLLEHIISIGINNIQCGSLQFSFKGINQWMNSTVIRKKIKHKGQSIFYDFEDTENDVFKISKYNIEFTSSVTCQTTKNSIYEECFWKLNAIDEKKYTLDDYLKYMHSFKDLIHLFIDSPTEYTFVDFDIAIEGKYRKSIKAYYFYEQYKSEKFPQVNISYIDIRDSFSVMLENWFEKNKQLGLIIDNYLNGINTNYFSDTKLLNSIKNLEIYHRNYVDQSALLPINTRLEEQKATLKKYVMEQIDPQFHDRFVRNIDFNPEITLSKRLTELFKQLDDNMKEAFIKIDGKNVKKSIKDIVFSLVQTRNYLTHGDNLSKYEKAITNTVDQLNTTSMLNQIIKYYIYQELGILEEEVINKIIRDRKIFR
ncbi:HEPN domain-containing protein [Ruoffia tabacinasalis]|uniref:HEPN domain-containing protein n=1 Tax=Ruoffia tabacinasalis TaxID=87458 RepID=UPI003F99622E